METELSVEQLGTMAQCYIRYMKAPGQRDAAVNLTNTIGQWVADMTVRAEAEADVLLTMSDEFLHDTMIAWNVYFFETVVKPAMPMLMEVIQLAKCWMEILPEQGELQKRPKSLEYHCSMAVRFYIRQLAFFLKDWADYMLVFPSFFISAGLELVDSSSKIKKMFSFIGADIQIWRAELLTLDTKLQNAGIEVMSTLDGKI